MAILKHIGRGPKSSIAAALTAGNLAIGDMIVTTGANGNELIFIERDGSQIVIKSRTQEDFDLLGTNVPAGSDIEAVLAILATKMENIESAQVGVSTSTVDGNVLVTKDESSTNVPVVGALVNPVFDDDAHTLTLTKLGATAAQNTQVVIPLGGASPETIISAVQAGDNTLTVKVTKFNTETETESTETIQLSGAVTGVDSSVAGVLDVATMGANGAITHAKQGVIGSVINASYDSTNKILTLPVVTGIDDNGVAKTTDVTVDLKTVVANAFNDVTHNPDTETASSSYKFSYNTNDGGVASKTVYETGTRKVEAGSTADKIKVTTADTTGALTSTEILIGAGSVKNPEYDADTRKITLPILQADGTTNALEINLGKDMVVKSGTYNKDTQNIELVLTDNSVVKIPAGSLVDVYTGKATATVSVSVSDSNEISATLKVSTVSGNLLKTDENGAYVVEDDFVATKQLIVNAEAAAKAYADEKVAEEVTARDAAIETAKGVAIETAKVQANAYTDEKVNELATVWVDFGSN